MIYEPPKIRPLGDCYLGVEFGDEGQILLNFRVLALADLLAREAIEGVRIPVWYDDPWGAALAQRYRVPKNIDFVAQLNDMTVPELIASHCSTDYWVTCVGFAPGCYFSCPMDRTKSLIAPKYETPRDYTPARMISTAGIFSCAYPVVSPGGYQLLGRMAVNIYEPETKNAAFNEDGVLFRAGDRLRYYPIDALEYDTIWEAVQAGEYEYDITEEVFDVEAYLAATAAS
jgi:allophanate hydrolase subunit 1